jgi:hypothetical protein
MSTKTQGTMADQLQVMNKQASETGRQGKTLMVFTVITIIFVRASPGTGF